MWREVAYLFAYQLFSLYLSYISILYWPKVNPMGARETLQKLADKKILEIRHLELQVAQAEAYLQALQDSMKLIPREQKDLNELGTEPVLRAGSALAQAQDILKAAGRPMHISEILKAMGKPNEKNERISLSGSMASYVRKGSIFRKTGPNRFSLIGMNDPAPLSEEDTKLPEGFGSVQ